MEHAAEQVQDEVLASDLRMEPEDTELTPGDLRARLAAVRHDGVAVVSRPQPEPMTAVACAILDQDRTPVAALSVVTRSAQLEPAVLAPAVIAVARAISRAVSSAPARAESAGRPGRGRSPRPP